MAWRFVPAHINEAAEPVDNLSGILSLVMVGSFILAINFAPVPSARSLVILLAGLTIITVALFLIRQRRTANPLFDLKVAKRPTFWVAAVGGIIVFGSLMGAMFIGQQYLQNVLGYSTISAGLAILPAAALMVLAAPRSAKLVESIGSRNTFPMLLLWTESASYWPVGLAYALVGLGIGLVGTPASRSLTASVPVTRTGMASGTADLQRDLGGAIMQSIFGALLAAGYAAAVTAAIAATSNPTQIPASVQSSMTMSFAGAMSVATQYPQYADQITTAARQAFLAGDQNAYIAGILAVLGGAALIFFLYPKRDEEIKLLTSYQMQNKAAATETSSAPVKPT